jgi:BNR/Asp-box repeat
MTGMARRAATTGRRRLLGIGSGVRFVLVACATLVLAVPVNASAAGRAQLASGPGRVQVGPVLEVSRGCAGQNAEVEQAVDYPYVYEAWIGCGGIGFARSTNGGRSFGHPLRVPGSAGHGVWRIGPAYLPTSGWDPAVAVAPDGTVYVSYMIRRRPYMHPVVAVSVDHGASFTRVAQVMPPAQPKVNWGDRDFIAVAPDGTIYLTWTYGPSARQILTGHGIANAVIQSSADSGKTWSRITQVSRSFLGGAIAFLLVDPDGRIDVLMWAGHHDYFTSSADGGRSWSDPVAVQPGVGRIDSPPVYWIDTALGIDAAGTLYATWDTQRPGGDIGWLSYSTDRGQTWSAARRVTPDHGNAGHLMAVAGGRPGIAYLGWLSPHSHRGFAQYLRPFSVRRGWLTAPVRVSRKFGNRNIWPGDTIGISVLPRGHGRPRVMVSWGSAVSRQISQIWAASLTGF